jgi:hypothetical protein
MTLKDCAWSALCAFARDTLPAYRALAGAYRMAEDATGLPWSSCGPAEWSVIVQRFGGGE